MLNVEQWAELRRLHFIERVGIRELTRRFGVSRKTVRRALRSAEPPRYSRTPAPSKLDPFKDEVHQLLKSDPRLPVVRLLRISVQSEHPFRSNPNGRFGVFEHSLREGRA